jgi:hypothetical protein
MKQPRRSLIGVRLCERDILILKDLLERRHGLSHLLGKNEEFNWLYQNFIFDAFREIPHSARENHGCSHCNQSDKPKYQVRRKEAK